jgi:hypothetical protein
LVIDIDSLKIVSYPYNHFPKHDNRYLFGNKSKKIPFVKFSFEIDWNTAIVYEKLDGHLVTLYYYKGEWQTSTKYSPDGSEEINNSSISLSRLFWQLWEQSKYQLPDPSKERCYMFELCSNRARKVSTNQKTKVFLIIP